MKLLTNNFGSSPLYLKYDSKMKDLQNNKVFFTLDELLYSQCALAMKLRNEPSEAALENLCNLVRRVLWPARSSLGAPVYVTSGYRSAVVNRAVGGVENSFHRLGRAADVSCHNNDLLYSILESLPHVELIRYKNFIHVAL